MADTAALLHEELSGTRAQDLVKEITAFYRSPGSAGYHAATNMVAKLLRDAGYDDLEETRYPIDGETVCNGRTMPLAWEPYGAKVTLVGPTQADLVDFEKAASCLAWWSQPTPPGGLTAEVIDVGTGESEADFEGKDLTGKIAFIRNTSRQEAWTYASEQVLERGAIGILTDYFLFPAPPIRTRENVPEVVQLLRLGVNNKGKYDAWACSVDYPTGQFLLKLLSLGPVVVHADIQCRMFKGEGNNILATIPGRELPDESVFFLAHTSTGCRPGANCAAGTAVAVEIACVLQKLIKEGKLPQPKRTIKFLILSEGLGSQAYISEHMDELPNIKASICFCSAGNNQQKSKATLILSRNPDSVPSFLNDYLQGVMDRVPKDRDWAGKRQPVLSSVAFEQVPYKPWSDNSARAAFGVPSVLVMSWPVIFFHSQLLTADTTDPNVMHRSAVTTAVAAYEIADAGPQDADVIRTEVYAQSRYRIETIANDARRRILSSLQDTGDAEDAKEIVDRTSKELEYFAERDSKALESTLGLVGDGQNGAFQQKIQESKEDLNRLVDASIISLNELVPTSLERS